MTDFANQPLHLAPIHNLCDYHKQRAVWTQTAFPSIDGFESQESPVTMASLPADAETNWYTITPNLTAILADCFKLPDCHIGGHGPRPAASIEGPKSRAALSGRQAADIFRRRPLRAAAANTGGLDHGSRPRPTASAVAREYGVSEKAVRDIWTARTWAQHTRHLEPLRPPRPARPMGRPPGSRDRRPRKRAGAGASKPAAAAAGPSPPTDAMATRAGPEQAGSSAESHRGPATQGRPGPASSGPPLLPPMDTPPTRTACAAAPSPPLPWAGWPPAMAGLPSTLSPRDVIGQLRPDMAGAPGRFAAPPPWAAATTARARLSAGLPAGLVWARRPGDAGRWEPPAAAPGAALVSSLVAAHLPLVHPRVPAANSCRPPRPAAAAGAALLHWPGDSEQAPRPTGPAGPGPFRGLPRPIGRPAAAASMVATGPGGIASGGWSESRPRARPEHAGRDLQPLPLPSAGQPDSGGRGDSEGGRQLGI